MSSSPSSLCLRVLLKRAGRLVYEEEERTEDDISSSSVPRRTLGLAFQTRSLPPLRILTTYIDVFNMFLLLCWVSRGVCVIPGGAGGATRTRIANETGRQMGERARQEKKD